MKTDVPKTESDKVNNNALEKFSIVTGVIMAIGYIGYFLLMAFLGLAAVPEYRVFNFVIQILAIVISIRYYKTSLQGHFSYLQGLALGCFSSFLGVLLYAAFFYLYLLEINPDLLPVLSSNASMIGKYLTPFTAALAAVIEGTIAGLIISFIIMQFFKDDALHNPLKKKSSEVE